MTEDNTQSGANEAGIPIGGEPKKAHQGPKPKRKYRRAQPSAFVQIDCGRPEVAVPQAPELPDPRWTAEFVAALVVSARR